MHNLILALFRRMFGHNHIGYAPSGREITSQDSYSIVFVVLRRMRMPLMILLWTYVIAVVGMMAMPGEVEGKPWYMSFFEAFYFISYVSTTIGFGEIPYAFSGAQRMWATFAMYLTVVSWIYAIGALLSLAQDNALRQTLTEINFRRTVQQLSEPFYIVCGYGGTGRALVNTLEERFIRTVVLEQREEALNDLMIANHPIYVPTLAADITKPLNLMRAGLLNQHCAGVIALTSNNQANLHVAIASKMLNPKVPVICKVSEDEVARNMASFGTDHILNPFFVFAASLHTTLRTPYLHMLREWFMDRRSDLLGDPLEPPQKGLWILCGFGRFGKAVYDRMKHEEDIEIIIVEANFHLTGYPEPEPGLPKPQLVHGRGTEAHTLQEAHINRAVGILIGTDEDADNLSIVMTARDLCSRRDTPLFVVLRQNRPWNQSIFEAAHADLLMKASQLTADYIRVLLSTPLLFNFMRNAKRLGHHWAYLLVRRLRDKRFYPELAQTSPTTWELTICPEQAPEICRAMNRGSIIRIEHLLRDPRDWRKKLPCLPLLLVRGEREIMLPEDDFSLVEGDRLLLCSTRACVWWMEWILQDAMILHYVSTGEESPRSYVWQWGRKRLAAWKKQRQIAAKEKQKLLQKQQAASRSGKPQ